MPMSLDSRLGPERGYSVKFIFPILITLFLGRCVILDVCSPGQRASERGPVGEEKKARPRNISIPSADRTNGPLTPDQEAKQPYDA